MSGHNKWSTIKHKKAKEDAKKGKAFSRLSKELMLAAKLGGSDADANPRLRSAILAAKAVNMPNDNIDRAIKKGAGELGGQIMEELCYEGYAAGGVAVIVDCLTDNRNRTAAEVRNIFNKNNGNLGGTGAVAWMFQRKARFVVSGDAADEMKLMELLFEAGVDVEDISVEEGEAEIIATPEAFADLLQALEGAGISVSESSIVRVPDNDTTVTDVSIARQVNRLIEAIEENDDVQSVYDNAEFSDEVIAALAAEE